MNPDDQGEVREELVPKPGTKSELWNYFGLKKDSNGHIADVLVDALEESMKEWSLNSKNLVCMTTDSGSNIVSAAKKLDWTRVSCFGHNLDLAITKALNKDKRCDRALRVTRKVVSAFSCSWKRRRELAKAQISLDIPKHSLVSVSTIIYKM